jgi:mannose-1-phosphate guanylyltransferase
MNLESPPRLPGCLDEQQVLLATSLRDFAAWQRYGYISPGEQKLNGYKVLQFKEKPDKETAELYLKTQGFIMTQD